MAEDRSREKLAEYLAEAVLEKCTGVNATRVCDDKPSKRFFIGTLNPKTENASSVFTKVAPCQMGIIGLIDAEEAKTAVLRVRISGVFYLKVFPTYLEQLEASRKKYRPLSSEEDEIEHEDKNSEEEAEQLQKVEFREVYEKTDKLNITVEKKISEILGNEGACEVDIVEVSTEVERIKKKAETNPNSFSIIKKKGSMKVVPDILDSEAEYHRYVEEVRGEKTVQDWELGARISIAPFKGKMKITITLENTIVQEKEPKDRENSFFESNIEMELKNGVFQPYVLEYLTDDYKFDGNIEADGINCSAVKPAPNKIVSEHIPLFKQKRFKSNEKIKADFQTLSRNPISELEKISDKMAQYLTTLEEQYETMKLTLTEKGKVMMRQDIKDYKTCLDRFKYGIEVLSMQTPIGKAINESFKLMNESFLTSAKGFKSGTPDFISDKNNYFSLCL